MTGHISSVIGRQTATFLGLLLTVAAVTSSATAGDWPGFLGPSRKGSAPRPGWWTRFPHPVPRRPGGFPEAWGCRAWPLPMAGW
ncbi:MAG: hypothetical protein CM1200mP2_43620 [Planctomycetaceae bacterium]|nr:MAG: hypothetical protein CM1200mP2_43620 [Planctomycetaceae bacterium]